MNEKLDHCPICQNNDFELFLQAEDHFLTKEKFSIMTCTACGFRFINPRPDSEEIVRYYQSEDYVSHNATKFNLFNVLYKAARYFAIRSKYKLIRSQANGGRLLDIGCGTGEVLKYCKSKGFSVQGVEPTETARRFAKEHNGLDVVESVDKLFSEKGFFNCITLWHVLEHVHDLNPTIEKIKALLNREGCLIIAVPNSASFDAQKYKEHWAAYDVPRHLYHFTHDTLQRLAERHGFIVDKIIPQKMDAYYVSLLSEKYLTGKSNYVKAINSGLQSNMAAEKTGFGHSSLIFLLSLKKM